MRPVPGAGGLHFSHGVPIVISPLNLPCLRLWMRMKRTRLPLGQGSARGSRNPTAASSPDGGQGSLRFIFNHEHPFSPWPCSAEPKTTQLKIQLLVEAEGMGGGLSPHLAVPCAPQDSKLKFTRHGHSQGCVESTGFKVHSLHFPAIRLWANSSLSPLVEWR